MTVELARYSAPGALLTEHRRPDCPAPDPFIEHSADGAFTQFDAVLACQDGAEFSAPPKRVDLADLKNPLQVLGRPLPAPHPGGRLQARAGLCS